MESGLSQLLEEVGRATATRMDDYLLSRGQELELVTGSSTLRNTPESAAYGLNRYLRTFEECDSIVFVDPQGEHIAHGGNPLLTKSERTLDDAIRRWMPQVRSGTKVIDMATDPGEFTRYIAFVKPVRHERGGLWLASRSDR